MKDFSLYPHIGPIGISNSCVGLEGTFVPNACARTPPLNKRGLHLQAAQRGCQAYQHTRTTKTGRLCSMQLSPGVPASRPASHEVLLVSPAGLGTDGTNGNTDFFLSSPRARLGSCHMSRNTQENTRSGDECGNDACASNQYLYFCDCYCSSKIRTKASKVKGMGGISIFAKPVTTQNKTKIKKY